MKTTIKLLFASAALMTSLNAQEAPKKEAKENKKEHGEHKGEHKGGAKGAQSAETVASNQANRIQKISGCSETQRATIYNLSLNKVNKIRAIREKYKGQDAQKEQAKTEIKAAREEFRNGVKATLTPEQFAKVENKIEQRKERKGPKGPKGPKGDKGEKGEKGEKKEVKETEDDDQMED